MKKLGIMQGRLSPPINNKIQAFPHGDWEEEFTICNDLGLECIEWIFEFPNYKDNPLCFDDKINLIKKLSKKYNVSINSVVADYFMEKKLFKEDRESIINSIKMLEYLIIQCNKSEIPIIELPFVDSSRINTDRDKKKIMKTLENPIKLAEKNNIKISLETSLPPKEFRDFILLFKPYDIYVNYDMGNSASLGFNPIEEIELLNDYIINIHIKDRVKNGGTVPLGSGDTDFIGVFNSLKKYNYSEDFILQAARQDIGNNNINRIETVKNYIKFISPFLNNL